MTSESGNGGGRLKGSQLGYLGNGVPDAKTIVELQKRYAERIEAGPLSPEIRAKLARMRVLSARLDQLTHGKAEGEEIKELWDENMEVLKELLPIMHFKVDDVDWDK